MQTHRLKGHVINTPEDMKGLKIRTLQTEAHWAYAAVPCGCALAIPTVIRRLLTELSGEETIDDNLEVHV